MINFKKDSTAHYKKGFLRFLVFVFALVMFQLNFSTLLFGQLSFGNHYFNKVLLNESTFDYNETANYRSTGKKLLYGTISSLSYDLICGAALYISPTEFSHWTDNLDVKANWEVAFTQPPVWDNDPWYVNYPGHIYMGSFYYNSVRSQGISIVTSSFFTLFQSALWEYVLEGMYERPSKYDLLVTPVLGMLAGELTNQLAIHLGRNGYTVFEKIVVIILNPNYAIFNGFKNKINYR